MEQVKKILIIGSRGMAGHVVKLYLEKIEKYEVWGIARNVETKNNTINLDVSNLNELEELIKIHKFRYVINCIGLLNKTAEENPELAIWFNSYFPHILSKYGNKYNFKLIHVSTDCVFSGKKGGYLETDFKDGIGYYAQSKALGEIENSKDLTFRTSIIGPELKKDGIGLFHWFMNQNQLISGFTKAFWTGVTTLELAKAIDYAIISDLRGLYHLVYPQKISKYDLLKTFNNYFRINTIDIQKNDVYSVDKSLINTREDFDFKVSSYENMISEMKDWIEEHISLYAHYNLG